MSLIAEGVKSLIQRRRRRKGIDHEAAVLERLDRLIGAVDNLATMIEQAPVATADVDPGEDEAPGDDAEDLITVAKSFRTIAHDLTGLVDARLREIRDVGVTVAGKLDHLITLAVAQDDREAMDRLET